MTKANNMAKPDINKAGSKILHLVKPSEYT